VGDGRHSQIVARCDLVLIQQRIDLRGQQIGRQEQARFGSRRDLTGKDSSEFVASARITGSWPKPFRQAQGET